MKKKKDEITIRSSAAEYLTYVASVGDQQDSIEMRYEDEKHWRSPQSSTNISCRDWKLLHAIRSRKSDRIRSYKILCKTEKIKKHLPIIISPEKELSTFHNSAAFIYSGVLSGPFTGLVDKYSEKPEKLIVF